MAKKMIKGYEEDKAELDMLYVQRSVQQTDKFDERINFLKEKINQFEFGSFNKTLTNKKSYSYKELVNLKKLKNNKI